MEACEVASLAVSLGSLEECRHLLDATSSAQQLNQLRKRVEVIRFLIKQLAVDADGILVSVIDEHEISVHECRLLV